jgi:hypothetical protein
MNKSKEFQQSDFVMEEKPRACYARRKKCEKKTSYIDRKVTQKLKNLKWFFWKPEWRVRNSGVRVCKRLLLNVEMIPE